MTSCVCVCVCNAAINECCLRRSGSSNARQVLAEHNINKRSSLNVISFVICFSCFLGVLDLTDWFNCVAVFEILLTGHARLSGLTCG